MPSATMQEPAGGDEDEDGGRAAYYLCISSLCSSFMSISISISIFSIKSRNIY